MNQTMADSGRDELQMKMDTYLSTMNPLDVLDIQTNVYSVGKYGGTMMFWGSVTYRQE